MPLEVTEFLSVNQIDFRSKVDVKKRDHLVKSVAESGVWSAIRVRPVKRRFVIVDGDQRLWAARECGLRYIPAIVEAPRNNPMALLKRRHILNVMDGELPPSHRARSLQRLLDLMNWYPLDAAAELGLDREEICRLLALRSLSKTLQKKIDAGHIGYQEPFKTSRGCDGFHPVRPARESASNNKQQAGDTAKEPPAS